VALVCATFPLIWVGALVTTEKAGMAVPDWPTTYGYNMFLYPLTTWLWGPWDLFIEHGHRLLASGVGMLTIACVLVLFLREPRWWVRGLGVLALVMVCTQGVLGGMRVVLDEVALAKLHGCLGPLFFAVCVGLACVTSRWWREAARGAPREISFRFQSAAAMLAAVAYLQLVLGAHLRHVSPAADPGRFQVAVWGHLLLALVVVCYTLLIAWYAARHVRDVRLLARPGFALAGLVAVQVLLGGASWMMKYGLPGPLQSDLTAGWTNVAGSMTASMLITGHVAIGSAIIATAVMLSLRSCRLLARPTSAGLPRHAMMEAAL